MVILAGIHVNTSYCRQKTTLSLVLSLVHSPRSLGLIYSNATQRHSRRLGFFEPQTRTLEDNLEILTPPPPPLLLLLLRAHCYVGCKVRRCIIFKLLLESTARVTFAAAGKIPQIALSSGAGWGIRANMGGPRERSKLAA